MTLRTSLPMLSVLLAHRCNPSVILRESGSGKSELLANRVARYLTRNLACHEAKGRDGKFGEILI
jgi:hypothetical protein